MKSTPLLLASWLAAASFGFGDTIDLTPDQMTPETYNPARILATTNKLIALGPQDAYASLLQYGVKTMPLNGPFDIWHRDYYLAWLCLLVYDPRSDTGLPIPMFGLPAFPNTGGYDDHGRLMGLAPWPRFPLALSRGVPFLLVSGYALGGLPEAGDDFLKRCQAHGDFHATPYAIPTRHEAKIALDGLISSPPWKALIWKDDQATFDPDFLKHEIDSLRMQVDRIDRVP